MRKINGELSSNLLNNDVYKNQQILTDKERQTPRK